MVEVDEYIWGLGVGLDSLDVVKEKLPHSGLGSSVYLPWYGHSMCSQVL